MELIATAGFLLALSTGTLIDEIGRVDLAADEAVAAIRTPEELRAGRPRPENMLIPGAGPSRPRN